MEVGEAGLVEDLSRFRDRVALVGSSSVLGCECVDEAVGELLQRQRDDAVPLRRVRERGGRRLQGRERQLQNALGRRRTHRHPGTAQTAVEQQLDEQAAVGMADQHGWLGEFVDQRRVVVDDLLHAEPCRIFGGLAHLLDITLLARPLRRQDREAPLAKVVDVVLPATRRKPGAVNQHQRDLPVFTPRACHTYPLLQLTC